MGKRYDVAVVGLGGMGSAVLAHAAKRGLRAIGFEQFSRGHDRGASSGRSRMIRKAYYEHPSYVPLLLRAYHAWRELESETETRLLHITGLLMTGDDRSEILTGALRSAQTYGLPVETLRSRDVRSRFPMFALRENERAVYEVDGGFIVPEAAVEAHLRVAERSGASLAFNAHADRLEEIDAERVVVCAGPWLDRVIRDLNVPLRVERNVQHWFVPERPNFGIGRCPSFLIERPEFERALYGFPDYGFGVKAAFHGSGAETRAEALDRAVHESDIAPVRAALNAALPGAAGEHLEGKACMYTLTPDAHFIISPHPRDPKVIVVGGFSGHGFKFTPVVGEIVADLLATGQSRYDIGFLSAERFAGLGN